MRQKTYKLPSRCDISTITMRETNGADERAAAMAADAKKVSAGPELIKMSIVAVDGKKVEHPSAVPLDSWSTRTRRAVSAFFDDLNDLSDEELGPLIAAAADDDSQTVAA